jgi:hypothetical protein
MARFSLSVLISSSMGDGVGSTGVTLAAVTLGRNSDSGHWDVLSVFGTRSDFMFVNTVI